MLNIAIFGASGLVGSKLIDIFNKDNFHANFLLFGNESVGKKLTIDGNTHTILHCKEINNFSIDYAMFMTSEGVSQQIIPKLTARETVCIDNSSYYRLHNAVPLIAPHVNSHCINDSKIIANPNCTTIQLVTVLNALKSLGLKRIVTSTYQSVSGAGKNGIFDLEHHCNYPQLTCFKHPIVSNLIPEIGTIDSEGIATEEYKVISECRKILALPELKISCLAVRVPTTYCHGISANIELENPFTMEQIKQLLAKQTSLIVTDDNENNYPMPINATGSSDVFVGRLSKDQSQRNCLNCFIVADNLLRGASYNAYEILLELIRRKND